MNGIRTDFNDFSAWIRNRPVTGNPRMARLLAEKNALE